VFFFLIVLSREKETKENKKWNIQGHLFLQIKREHIEDLSSHHLHAHILTHTKKSKGKVVTEERTYFLFYAEENAKMWGERGR
jgi:hypothetical protein